MAVTCEHACHQDQRQGRRFGNRGGDEEEPRRQTQPGAWGDENIQERACRSALVQHAVILQVGDVEVAVRTEGDAIDETHIAATKRDKVSIDEVPGCPIVFADAAGSTRVIEGYIEIAVRSESE